MSLIRLIEERVKNENARREISDAFNDLVYNRLNLNHKIEDMFRSYLIDGRLYYEKVIDEKNKKNGIISIKKLPSESMDFDYDVITGKIKMFMQYLKPEAKRAITIEEARKRKDIILFYPDQISFIDYGVYGRNRKDSSHPILINHRIPQAYPAVRAPKNVMSLRRDFLRFFR